MRDNDNRGIHPCPTPSHPRKGGRDGDLWACTCGKIYVRRHWWNYAGEGFDWKPTGLVLPEGR